MFIQIKNIIDIRDLLNAFRRSAIPQKQFTITIDNTQHTHTHTYMYIIYIYIYIYIYI